MKFQLELDLTELGLLYDSYVVSSTDSDLRLVQILKSVNSLGKICDLTIRKNEQLNGLGLKITQLALPLVSRDKLEYFKKLKTMLRAATTDRQDYHHARDLCMQALKFISDKDNQLACLLDQKAAQLEIDFLEYTLADIINPRLERTQNA